MQDLNKLASKLYRERSARIERLLVGAVEAWLGRVPTNLEVFQYGKRVVVLGPTGRQMEESYFWDGYRILSLKNHENGFGFDVEYVYT